MTWNFLGVSCGLYGGLQWATRPSSCRCWSSSIRGRATFQESATLSPINRRHPHAKPHFSRACLRIAEFLTERRPPLQLARFTACRRFYERTNNPRCNCPLIVLCEQTLCHWQRGRKPQGTARKVRYFRRRQNVVARYVDMGCYLEAMQLGAVNYLAEPLTVLEIGRVLENHPPIQSMAA